MLHVNRIIRPLLPCLALIAAAATSPAPLQAETVSAQELVALDTHPALQTGGFATSITTGQDGLIYLAWVDPARNAMVGQYDPATDTLTTQVVFTNVFDDGHHKVSLGIDERGYIHYAGDMHSHSFLRPDNERDAEPAKSRVVVDGEGQTADTMAHSWQYWVSDQPFDISSFTFEGSTARAVPGIHVSYPRFKRDRTGTLYATFRHRITPNPNQFYHEVGQSYSDGPGYFHDGDFVRGTFAGGVARYDAVSQTWTMLGGSNYSVYGSEYDPADDGQTYSQYSFAGDFPSLMWHRTGREAGPLPLYQGFNNDIFFDANNRMHLTWAFYSEDSSPKKGGFSTSHLMYAYSDDGGDTWHKADGTQITSLPITISNGDVANHQDDTYTNEGFAETGLQGGLMRGFSWLGVKPDGHPRLFTNEWIGNDGNTVDTHTVEYEAGTGWGSFDHFEPTGIETPLKIATDMNGYMMAQRQTNAGARVMRSFDGGDTWTRTEFGFKFSSGGENIGIDQQHINDTGNIRMTNYDDSTATPQTRVWEVTFDPAVSQPAYDLVAPSNLVATKDSGNPTSRINLTWTDKTDSSLGTLDEDGFKVERKIVGSGNWVQLAGNLPADTTSYQDTAVEADTQYEYRVRAFIHYANSPFSPIDTATTDATTVPPDAPGGLAAAADGIDRLAVSWTDNSNNEDGFVIERSLSSGSGYSVLTTTAQNAESFVDTSVARGTTYYYRVKATNQNGDSAYIGPASATSDSTTVFEDDFNADALGAFADGAEWSLSGGQRSFFITEDSADLFGEGTANRYFSLDNDAGARTILLTQNSGSDVATLSFDWHQPAGSSVDFRLQLDAFTDDSGDNRYGRVTFENDKVQSFFDAGAEATYAEDTTYHYDIIYNNAPAAITVAGHSIPAQDFAVFRDGGFLFTGDDQWQTGTAVGSNLARFEFGFRGVQMHVNIDNVVVSDDAVVNTGTATVPAAPGDLTAAAVSSSEIDLDWTDNSDNEDGFVVEYSTDGGSTFNELSTEAADVTSLHIDGLEPDSVYEYRIRATNAVGYSAWSETANARTHSLAEDWRLEHFGQTENQGNAADSADPDGDGRHNRAEYAFLTDPHTPGARNPVTRIESLTIEGTAYLEFAFDVHWDPSLQFELRSSENLADDWTTLWSTGQTLDGLTETVEDGVRTIRYRIPLPSGGDSPRKFLRLRLQP